MEVGVWGGDGDRDRDERRRREVNLSRGRAMPQLCDSSGGGVRMVDGCSSVHMKVAVSRCLSIGSVRGGRVL